MHVNTKRNLEQAGIPEVLWPALVQEGHYMGNHVGGRPSDSVASAIHAFTTRGIEGLSSPLAKSMMEEGLAALQAKKDLYTVRVNIGTRYFPERANLTEDQVEDYCTKLVQVSPEATIQVLDHSAMLAGEEAHIKIEASDLRDFLLLNTLEEVAA